MNDNPKRKKSESVSTTSNSCILCGKSSIRQIKFEALGVDEKAYVIKHYGKEPSTSSYMCKAHYMEAKRKHSDGNHVPNWAQQATVQPSSTKLINCVYPECLDTDQLITPSFKVQDDLKAALPVAVSPDQPFVLCPSHYHKLYRHFKVIPCAGCGTNPKRGTRFTRRSPDAITVSHVLSENAGFDDVNIGESDNIFFSCYKSHLAIIKSIENEDSCTDYLLEDLITIWQYKYTDKETDKVTSSLLHVVLFVVQEFINQRAVLLPNVSKMFCQVYDPEHIDTNLQLEVSEGTFTFTSKWLLNQLIVHFQDHIKHRCIHKKFGTVLYHKGSDLLVSLSWALGRMHESSADNPNYQPPKANEQLHIVMEAADIINETIILFILKSQTWIVSS